MKLYNDQAKLTNTVQIFGAGIVATFRSHKQELIWLILIFLAGLLPRMLFVINFPTSPISDFRGLLDFAILFREDLLAKEAWQWRYFPPGFPIILSFLLVFSNEAPEVVGRWATAIVTGLTPVLPYLVWRGVFPHKVRVFAALFLALWPGQILFSSVLAQDNWVIFPTVALCTLAVRLSYNEQERFLPVFAAIFYAMAVAIRQDMMLVTLPVLLLVFWFGWKKNRIFGFYIPILVIGLVFGMLILQRGLATGRYSLTSDHFGEAILGAYAPGAGMNWIDPRSYVESVRPDLIENGRWNNELEEEALNLVWQEFSQHPKYHLIRISGSTLMHIFEMDKHLLWWSLGGEVLPDQFEENANKLMRDALPILVYHPVVINALFISSLFFALHHRRFLLITGAMILTIVLKVGLHAVTVSQPRYFLIVMALEMLIAAVFLGEMLKEENRKPAFASIALGIVTVMLLLSYLNYAKTYIDRLNVTSLMIEENTVAESVNSYYLVDLQLNNYGDRGNISLEEINRIRM